MNVKCSIGLHNWNGCQCTECDKIRDEMHAWSQDSVKCLKCGKQHSHNWENMILSNTNGEYDLITDKCTICGITKNIRLKSNKLPVNVNEFYPKTIKQIQCPKCVTGICYVFEKKPQFLRREKYQTPDAFISVSDIFLEETVVICVTCGWSEVKSLSRGNQVDFYSL